LPISRIGGQGDNAIIPVAATELEIEGDGGEGGYGTLRLPGGRLTIVGPGANVVFTFNGEFFFKPE
jgi:hypothetical protein